MGTLSGKILEAVKERTLCVEKYVADVVWDPVNGIGSVPDSADIEYLGFVKKMLYSEFRRLVPPGNSNDRTKEYVMKMLKKGASLGNPFLVVEWNYTSRCWDVLDHEGRSRVDAVNEMYPDYKFYPIHIFPTKHMRSRDITQEMRKCPFVPQGGGTPIHIGED